MWRRSALGRGQVEDLALVEERQLEARGGPWACVARGSGSVWRMFSAEVGRVKRVGGRFSGVLGSV